MNFVGIAFGGRKSSGKDTALDFISKTRNITVVRCKQPIVDRYLQLRDPERYTTESVHRDDCPTYPDWPHDMSRPDNEYIKSRDDGDLIWFSSRVIRDKQIGDPQICSRYLYEHIPKVVNADTIPVVPDMRRFEENDTLFAELAQHDYPMLCVKLDAPLDVLMKRTVARDGSLQNWHPEDDTEREIDDLRYHYIVDNSKNVLRSLAMQLETVLYRYPRLRRTKRHQVNKESDQIVRIVDHTDDQFWQIARIIDIPNEATFLVKFSDTNETRTYMRTDLIAANGECF